MKIALVVTFFLNCNTVSYFDDNILKVYFFFSIFHINISPNRSDVPLNQQFAVISEVTCELSHSCNLTMGANGKLYSQNTSWR